MKIEGLKNQQQADMLKKMWACKDISEVKKWQATLSPSQRQEAEILELLLVIEVIDEDTKQMADFPLAKQVLQNIM